MFDYQQIPSVKYAEEYDKIQWNSSDKGAEDNEPEEDDKREVINNGFD